MGLKDPPIATKQNIMGPNRYQSIIDKIVSFFKCVCFLNNIYITHAKRLASRQH